MHPEARRLGYGPHEGYGRALTIGPGHVNDRGQATLWMT